jgi:hypothetical protein
VELKLKLSPQFVKWWIAKQLSGIEPEPIERATKCRKKEKGRRRTKVLNGELEEVFRRWYPRFRAQAA